MTTSRLGWIVLQPCIVASSFLVAACAAADQKPSGETSAQKSAMESADQENADLKRLAKDYDLWMDAKRKLVVVGGKVCLRAGALEMFACPKHTKEHESIVAANCKAKLVHAALVAVGARPGHPVRYDPEYAPASGTTIDITVAWKDQDGKQRRARAQDWIRDVQTGAPMPYSWVFAGSGFLKDKQTGEEYYYAEAGDLICVSNFPSATLDLPVKSSQDNSSLLFEAFTERIPPLGTEVRLILKPRMDKEGSSQRREDGAAPKKPAASDAQP